MVGPGRGRGVRRMKKEGECGAVRNDERRIGRGEEEMFILEYNNKNIIAPAFPAYLRPL